MSENSKIEWTQRTWNPILGCARISPGCDRCYAITQARIRAANPNPKIAKAFEGLTARTDAGLDWTGRVNLLPERLTQPLRLKKPTTMFVNSLSDLFHKDVPDEFIARVFAVMAATPQHTYQLLTKRHGRMRSLLSRGDLGTEGFPDMVEEAMAEFTHASLDAWPLPNVWLGVSAEDQRWADIRIPALLATPAAVRFVSAEPLLGQLDLGFGDPHRGHETDDVYGYPHPRICLDCSGPEDEDEVQFFRREPDAGGISWVIVGGESGPGARPMSERWARTLVQECQSAQVPVFVKQLGSVLGKQLGAGGKGGDMSAWPEDLRVRQFPRATEMTGVA